MPTAFPQQDIPLVGQPMQLAGYTLNVFFVCRCQNPQPLVVTLVHSLAAKFEARSPVKCPACGRKWGVGQKTSVNMDLALDLSQSADPLAASASPH